VLEEQQGHPNLPVFCHVAPDDENGYDNNDETYDGGPFILYGDEEEAENLNQMIELKREEQQRNLINYALALDV
jgi:hypothetical protein